MASITIRNLPDETHRALKALAAQHGRSTEAEVRRILERAVAPPVALGTLLQAVGRATGGLDLPMRDKSGLEPAGYE
jgi:plasmid stability protein